MQGYIYMFAEPPTCKVKYTVFDVNNDQTQVEVTLENPNNAPMKIDRLDYEINRALTLTSSSANQTGSIPLPLTIPSCGSPYLESRYPYRANAEVGDSAPR